MYSKYERRTDTRTYEDRRKLYEGVSFFLQFFACFGFGFSFYNVLEFVLWTGNSVSPLQPKVLTASKYERPLDGKFYRENQDFYDTVSS